MRYEEPSIRFWRKVNLGSGTGCWEWDGWIDPGGYGRFWNGKRTMVAHRWSYEAANGTIPDGLILDHLCRNRRCVNPLHLEAVTQGENTRRGLTGAHQAAKTHCPHNHEYTPENTRRARGQRICITCARKACSDWGKRKRGTL